MANGYYTYCNDNNIILYYNNATNTFMSFFFFFRWTRVRAFYRRIILLGTYGYIYTVHNRFSVRDSTRNISIITTFYRDPAMRFQ